MGAHERITIELPVEVAERLRARVAAGDFTSESAAVLEALLAIEAGDAAHPDDLDPAIDAWLRGPVAEAYDEVVSGNAPLFTLDEVRGGLSLKRG